MARAKFANEIWYVIVCDVLTPNKLPHCLLCDSDKKSCARRYPVCIYNLDISGIIAGNCYKMLTILVVPD